MPGSTPKPLYTHWAFWVSFFLVAIFPAVGVNFASPAARLGWAIILSALFALTLAAHARASKDPVVQSAEQHIRRRPIARAILLVAPALTLILSVAATYALPERPLLWQVTRFFAQLGGTVFPIVGKFATHIAPPLAPAILYKAQSIVTLFMLTSLALAVSAITRNLMASSNERRAIRKMQERYGRKARSPVLRWLCIVLGTGFSLAVFFGWFGFSPEPKDMSGKRCLVTAACYVQDDILLLVGAFFDSFMSFIILAGVVVMLRNAIDNDKS